MTFSPTPTHEMLQEVEKGTFSQGFELSQVTFSSQKQLFLQTLNFDKDLVHFGGLEESLFLGV